MLSLFIKLCSSLLILFLVICIVGEIFGITLFDKFQIDPQYIPFEGMTKCCNEHDYCYGTCNKDKEKCDAAFKRCLYDICDKLKSKVPDVIKTGKFLKVISVIYYNHC